MAKPVRMPQAIFDRFAVDPFNARKEMMEWLFAQPSGAGQRYVILHPETGEDMIVSAPVN